MFHPRPHLVPASLLALICFLLGGIAQAETYSGTWRFTGFEFSGTKPAGSSVWNLQAYTSTGAVLSFSGTVFTSDNTATFMVPNKISSNAVTAEWAYVAIGYNQTGVGFVPKMWCQCRPNDGRPAYDPPRNGPYDESGNREDSAGNPVNDQGEGIPEPEPDGIYRYDIVYNNGNNFPVHINYTVQEGADGGGEILMIGNSASIQPGTGWSKTFRYAYPFGVSWLVAREDNDEQVGDPVDGIADETEEPQPDTGEPGGPGGPLSPGGDTSTPGNIQVAKPDPITPVTRPDAPIAGEGNAEARHSEAMQGIGRVVDAVNDAANQAAGDADITNKYLSEIGDKLDGIEEGMGETSNAPPVATPEEAESEDATGIIDAVGGLLTALGQLQGAVQIGQAGGEALRFDIDVFDVPIAFNLEPYNDTFTMIREALLWIFRLMFVFKSVQVVRGAFA